MPTYAQFGNLQSAIDWLNAQTANMTDEQKQAYLQQLYAVDPQWNGVVQALQSSGAWQSNYPTTGYANTTNYVTRGNVPVPDDPYIWIPQAWQGNRAIPQADFSEGVQFQEALNASIPWLSPVDQTWAMSYLAAQQPETYGSKLPTSAGYDVAAKNANVPRQDNPNYDTARRYQTAENMLLENWAPTNPDSQPLLDRDSPVYEWARAILGTAKTYGTEGEQVGNRRTRYQQSQYDDIMSNLLSSSGAAAHGVSDDVYNMWSEYFRRLVAPTQTFESEGERANAPSWRTASYMNRQRGSNRGWGYQNTRWT